MSDLVIPRCPFCGGRTSTERAGGPCFVCQTYGPRRRPIRPGLRFRVVAGRTEAVVDGAAAGRMTEKGARFATVADGVGQE